MGNNYFEGNKGNRGRNNFSGYAYSKARYISGNNEKASYNSSKRLDGKGENNKGRKEKREIPIALRFVIDILCVGLLMLIFYFAEFSEPKAVKGEVLTPSTRISASASISPAKTNSSSPKNSKSTNPSSTKSVTTNPSPTKSVTVDNNNLRAKFADKFTSGNVIKTDHSYQSANININITKRTDSQNSVDYYLTDIYIADIKYFKTSFANDAETMGPNEYVYKILKNIKGIVGINGDFCTRNYGLTIRNGKYFKNKDSSLDLLVMYNDGTMKTYGGGYDKNEIKAQAPYQTWGFGPILLDGNGQPMTEFNTTKIVAGKNPRSAIGYYEPGHYCFVSVDGRSEESDGYTMEQLSHLMHDLGCKAAFNLDGGASSQLAFMGEVYNHPCGDRKDPDIIYITDEG